MKERKDFLERITAIDMTNQKINTIDEKPEKSNTQRGAIKVGAKVLVVQKQHQGTEELTEGIVKDILTNSRNHHRGIKVRLESGIVGRVQKII
jgi:uncharacterized repeat protein (TIGR03833 family)